MRSPWDELLSAALVGTERRAVPGVVPRTVPEAAPRADGRDPAQVLLERAALLAVERHAGVVSGHAQPPAPAAPDTSPVVGPAARQRLARMLAGDHLDVLDEWLTAVAAAGRRAPEPLLPALLDRGLASPPLQPLIAAVVGQRGRWLATLNPYWRYLLHQAGLDSGAPQDGAADPDVEVWELGGRWERLAALTRLRGRDPAAARAALAATWAKEPARDRAGFLATLADGLSAQDEPFLEAALDDRSAAVRDVAADLLARLPGSAFGRRMAERALRCVRVEQRRLRGARIVVEPPAAHDQAMQRDGVRRAPARKGTGTSGSSGTDAPAEERGWWLEQLVARTPLTAWVEHLNATPAEILRLSSAKPTSPLGKGWIRAAVHQHDTAWADALLAHFPHWGQLAVTALLELKHTIPPDRDRPPGALLAIASPDAAQRYAADLLTGAYRVWEVLELLPDVPGPWRGDLAGRVLATLRDRDNPWRVGPLYHLAATRLPPELADEVDGLVPDPPVQMLQLADTLRFRHDMLTELRS